MNIKQLTTNEAANELGVTPSRVRQMVMRGQLKAKKRGRDLSINGADLESVRSRPMGRPKKNNAETPPAGGTHKLQTAFDLAPELMRRLSGKYESGVPDLASNKKHLEGLGRSVS